MKALWLRLRSDPVLLARVLLGAAMLLEVLILWLGPSASAAKRELAEAAARQDKVTHWEPEADLGIHYAALINLGLLGVLALLAPLWIRPFQTVPEDDPLLRNQVSWPLRLGLPALMVGVFALVYGVCSFAPRSLWWDEMWAVKQCVAGDWKEDKKHPGELKFQPTTWKRCAFYYQKPTNHPMASVLQKVSHTAWSKITGAAPGEISELALRLPALLASGIAVLLLMRLVGAGKGVAIGALLLMLHPWHLRYGVEVRGYAFIVPLCVSGLLAARRVIFTRGRSVWAWTWLGANQGLWIWNYPTEALNVAVLFAVIAVFLWRGEEERRDRWTALLRLVAAHALGAVLCIQLFLPNMMQTRHWAGKEDQGHELDAGIAKDTLGYLTLGTPWSGAAQDTPEGAGLRGVVQQLGSEPAAWAVTGALLALSAAGLAWALRHQPRTGWLLLSPVIGALIYIVLGAATGTYFYPRFIIAVLPVFVAGLALSGQLFSLWTQVQRRIVLGVMVALTLLSHSQRTMLMTRPYAGFKQAAELIRHLDAPPHSDVVCYGLGREVAGVYLPGIHPAANAADLQAALDKARTAGGDLLVLQGYTIFNRARMPDGMALLDDRSQYEELGVFPGIEPDFLFRVLRARATKKP